MTKRRFALFAAVVSIAATAAATRAETINCTAITALPYTITNQGIYCFTSDLQTGMTYGNAITINASNVVVDMNGFKLGNLAAGPATLANGFYAAKRQNITIKNGTVRGFETGIFFDDDYPYTTSRGHVVEAVRADQNKFEGVRVHGSDNIVRGNAIFATGGNTDQNGNAHGMAVVGQENRVIDNDVSQTFGTSGGVAVAIDLPISTDNLVVGNRITNADIGIEIAGSGKYRDNLTIGVTTPYLYGTDAGNNQ